MKNNFFSQKFILQQVDNIPVGRKGYWCLLYEVTLKLQFLAFESLHYINNIVDNLVTFLLTLLHTMNVNKRISLTIGMTVREKNSRVKKLKDTFHIKCSLKDNIIRVPFLKKATFSF